jgi:hypothetical protein
MEIRLPRSAARLDARIKALSREMQKREKGLSDAQRLRQRTLKEREALMKAMSTKVADLCLNYLRSDSGARAQFVKWAGDHPDAKFVRSYFDIERATEPSGVASSAGKSAVGPKRRGPKKNAAQKKAVRRRKSVKPKSA